MAEVEIVLSQQRSLALALEAVALDLEWSGLSTQFIRGQIGVIREAVDGFEKAQTPMSAAG